MIYREGPEFPFFCHICGAPPTWRGLLADSTLQHLAPEEDDFDHRDYRYPDFMPHQENLGYDARLLPPRHIRWLDAVRLVTKKIVDTVKFTVTDGHVPLLTPLVRAPDFFGWGGNHLTSPLCVRWLSNSGAT
jgi:hypothetical protein